MPALKFSVPWKSVVASTAVLFAAGCGGGVKTPPLGQVSGVVTLDGQPVPRALVQFNPEVAAASTKKGEPAIAGSSAISNSEGRYELVFSEGANGAVVGTHTVQVRTLPDADPDDKPPAPDKIPFAYNLQSQLKFEVKPGQNTIDLNLDSKAKVAKVAKRR